MPTVEQHRERMAKVTGKKAQEFDLTVCLDPPLENRLKELKSAPRGHEEEILRLEGDVVEATETLTMKSVGRVRYDDLIRACPATDEQHEQHKKEFNGEPAPYDGDEFPIMLVAASLTAAVIDPVRGDKDEFDDLMGETLVVVRRWSKDWNATEFAPLWMTALAANTATGAIQLGKAFGGMNGSVRN
jgi:hypothetical protein